MSYSIVIPMIEIIHINKFHICGVSKRSSKSILIHYDRNGKRIGRTIRNGFGEPNHFGRKNETVGYSRNKSNSKITHYDSTGRPVGFSKRVMWIFWLHHGLISKWDVIYQLW